MIVVIVVVIVVVVLYFLFNVSVSGARRVGCSCWGCGCVVTHTTPCKWAIVHVSAYLAGGGELAGGRRGGDVFFPTHIHRARPC